MATEGLRRLQNDDVGEDLYVDDAGLLYNLESSQKDDIDKVMHRKAQEAMSLDLQIATDELMTEGSADGLIDFLLKMQGVKRDASLPRLPVIQQEASEGDIARQGPDHDRRKTYIFQLPSLRYDMNDPTNEYIKQALQKNGSKAAVNLAAEGSFTSYAYRSLSTAAPQIRLLRIRKPADADIYTEIDVQHYLLSEAPPYLCLSYVWGAPNRSVRILCNGEVLMVTQNLYDALIDVFQRFPERYLWADGICINQDDLDERAQQVRIMDRIYSRCEFALAHLNCRMASSKNKSETRRALSLMNFMVTIWENHEFTADDDRTMRQSLWIDYRFPDANEENSALWNKLIAFSTEDWFFRTWIVPECVLSPRMLILYDGYVISLEAVMSFWDLASRRGLPLCLRRGELGSLFDIIRHITPVHAFRKMREGRQTSKAAVTKTSKSEQALPELASENQPARTTESTVASYVKVDSDESQMQLLHLMAMCRMSNATDKRDKIYAMISLANDNVARSIVQNYDPLNTVSAAYVDVARRYAEACLGTELLQHAGRDRKLQDLPSWVPDWTYQSRSALRTHLYSATRNLPSRISLSKLHASALDVRAAVFSTISTYIGPSWRFFSSGKDKYQLVHDTLHPYGSESDGSSITSCLTDEQARCSTVTVALEIAEFAARHLASEVLYPKVVRQAVARTLCADCSHNGNRINVSEDSLQAFLEAFAAFEKWYSQPILDDTIPDEAATLQLREEGKFVWTARNNAWLIDCDPDGYDIDPLLAKVWQFSKAMQEAQRGRKFAVLPPGLFALVPWDAQAGDLVVLVPGSNVPFVVRRIAEPEENQADGKVMRVELIGDCYVHGLMDGEWIFRGHVEGQHVEQFNLTDKDGHSCIGLLPTLGEASEQPLLWKEMSIC